MNKFITLALIFICCSSSFSQDKNAAREFWNSLQKLCGKSYEGYLELPKEDAQFGGKKLVMHVRSCSDTVIKIPFFVGDDKSRTWVLSYKDNRISLKHDHRHKDGSEDKITQYGGTASNSGQAGIQIFPADAETAALIPAAAANVWWITVDDTRFTYNLRRLGTDRVFKVVMDLTKTVENPGAPWGWKE
ncbi:hypothetical protein GWK08_09050 [Leptobacterium flavescens]|uniref:Secreted protein n=1 Tax=Leptobacterium flavescens TaxID=472055 RepID=A0A6P0ULZ2_9FLAO|nr:hypothetical protein [Leptobacterium flavescens]NER13582.1 hypothetical protein [Leptobacterium flavescens]